MANLPKMKTKLFSLATLILVAFSACKNEKRSTQAELEDSGEGIFTITLNVTVKKDDNFQVYFVDKTGEVFSEEKSVWQFVKGQETPQKVVLSLPKGVVPDLIRLDFGLSDNQEDIILSEVDLGYKGKTFEAKGPKISELFRPLPPAEIDFKTGVLKAIKKDGKRIESALHPQEATQGSAIDKLTT
jgi:outer membrane lipoprotein-sorting protein